MKLATGMKTEQKVNSFIPFSLLLTTLAMSYNTRDNTT